MDPQRRQVVTSGQLMTEYGQEAENEAISGGEKKAALVGHGIAKCK